MSANEIASVSADVPASVRDEVKSRSLWGYAWLRLLRNRAAVVSFAVLATIGVLCVFCPWLLPHKYNAIYRDYIKVPASLDPYPHNEQVISGAKSALERAHLTVDNVTIDGDIASVKASSHRKIDDRVVRYLDASDMFSNARVIAHADGGLSVALTADISRHTFLFGTDPNGRDLLVRTLVAGRVSLSVAVVAASVAVLIGIGYGAVSGYVGGRVDNVMMRFVEIVYSLPLMFFIILLLVFFGRDFYLVFIGIGAVSWLDMARIVRGQTMSLRQREFVQAAEALGVGSRGILARHVVPNMLGIVIIYTTLMVPQVILAESFLSFLGLGVQEPMTSWGMLISDGVRSMRDRPGLLIFPSIFLVITLFALNFIGDGLRDALDPKDT